MVYVVPNMLADAINKKLDQEIAKEPAAEKCREYLYKQLLQYFIEHGVIPKFSLQRKTEL